MNVHSSKYKCTECGKCVSSNQKLTVHRRSHSVEKPFECTVCSKRFTQSGDLARHSRIHSGEKPHKCPDCDKAFSVFGNLISHTRVHTGNKPYKCSLCDKSFSHPAICNHINVIYTATEDLMTVVIVERCLKVAVIWSIMCILTLVQSRTHVDTVQSVLENISIWKHICWSHTMKVLGSHVTFVRRNAASKVILSSICFVMKVWSHMFVMNVQSVSVQYMNWNIISWNILILNSFAVVPVANITNSNNMLWVTSTDVLLNWDTSISLPGKIETENKQCVDNCLFDRVATVDLRLVSEIHTHFLFSCYSLCFWALCSLCGSSQS